MSEPLRAALAAILAASAPATSASAAAADSAPTRGWIVDWGDQRCSLIRQSGAATFALRTVPGSGSCEVRLVSRTWPGAAIRNAPQLTPSLPPGGEPLPGA